VSASIALALQHYQASRFDQAELLCQQILQQQPDEIAALHLAGLLAAQRQQFEQAIDRYQQVLTLQPRHVEAHNNLGILLMRYGRVDEAIAHYRQALAVQPDVPEILVNLGNALQEKEELEEAIGHYHQALRLNPNLAAAYKNLGHVLRMQGRLIEAIPCHQRAIALKSNDPEAHFGLAFTQLISGDLLGGFAEYEWRWQLPYNQPRSFQSSQWNGDPLAGRTLLLYAEQGLGDTLQFIRYVSLLAEQGRVIVECQKSLLRLLKTIPSITVVAQGELLPAFDLHAPLLSLPRLLRTTLATIPAAVPYLQLPAEYFPPQLPVPSGTQLKIGIAWAGDPKNPINRRRSCPLNQFLTLLEIPGVTLYSLQKGAAAADLAQIQHDNLIDLGEQLQDFADTAAVVQQLDLVVTIDTALAHLAGALGHQVWVVLPFAPDWRWLLHRTDCPWYPTMRLFCQPRSGDWHSVFTQIREQISKLHSRSHSTLLPSSLHPTSHRLGIGWRINPTLGWGVYGLNLTLQLLRHSHWQPVLLLPPVITAITNPLHCWQLRSLLPEQERIQQQLELNSSQIGCDFPVLYALANDFTTIEAIASITSPQKVGVVFFENTQLSLETLARARSYDRIVTGSTWNAQILQAQGVDRVVTVHQGIDPTLFYMAPRSKLLSDRFVIFSGGKLGYRQGQDMAIAAFRQFRARYPEALLMVAWHHHWVQSLSDLEQAGYVVGHPQLIQNRLQMVAWLGQNGIPPEAVLDLGFTDNARMGQIMHSVDVAIFPNRAEGGTNLMAMAALSCGIPTILSANTGHLDLIHDQICYPLSQQNPVKPTTTFPGVEGWGESSVEELVALLEQVYCDRSTYDCSPAQQKGTAAAQWMKDWTWEKQTQRLLEALE
jgi:Flp pilus assembly protein TadD/glycosyltransferase involved in cell wall biosynthesis